MKTNRFICLFLAVMMLLSIVPFTAISATAAVTSVATTNYEGSGEENDPYIAMSASDLAGFIHSDKNLHIKLGANITLSGSIFVESNITIDMNGYTITSNATSYAFRITQGHNLKIKGTGKIKYTDNLYIFYVDGTLETNGTVTYECPTKAGTIICTSDYGKVIINGGNFIGQQILINGVGKLYVYGGNFATEILINKTSVGYIYGGSFNGKILNYNALRIYGGEFLKDVSSYGDGVTGIYAGYFKEGVSNNSSTNGKHILGEGSICLEHSKNTITETGVFIYTEMTVYRPDFAELTPELPEGETEVDAGTINAFDDYIVSFKAKDVPDIFVKNGFTIEEKIIVKDSDGYTDGYEIMSGTKAQGVEINLNHLTGGDYTVERIVNLYQNGSLKKTNQNTVKIKVNPLSDDACGFRTMTPSVNEDDMKDGYTELSEKPITTETLTFGFTPQILKVLYDKGYRVKGKVYINYENQGTLATRDSGADFNLMDYVKRTGDYQVWFVASIYKDDEFITSKTHIYNVPIVLDEINEIKATVTAPTAGAYAFYLVDPVGEGYKTTDIDWLYYNETTDKYEYMVLGMTFEAGKTYECRVEFEVIDGYTFPKDKGYLAGYINGNRGTILNNYSTDKTEVSYYFTVPEKTNLEVIFTPDSKAEVGSKLTVDIERMAELDDELMQAYFDGTVTYKWFYDGRLQTTTKNNSYEIKNTMLGHYIAVKVVYGDKSIVSEEFEITKESTTGKLGDVDGDGDIAIMDATQIQFHLADLETLTVDQLSRADTYKDSNITIMDVTQIQLFLAEIITEF